MVGSKRKCFDVVPVRTVELKDTDTLLAVCKERADAWASMCKQDFCTSMISMLLMQCITKFVAVIFV